MSLLSWAWRRFKLTDHAAIQRWFGSETWSGKPVTVETALNLSVWFRCVKLYADVTGAASWKLYERLSNGERKQVTDHPIYDLIAIDPNIDQTPQEFWGGVAAQLCVQGNSYAEKRYLGSKLIALQPLPFETYPYRNSNDDLRYRFIDRGKQEDLPADKVFHTKGFNLGSSDVGLSPLAAARQSIGIALAQEEATGKTFAQGLRASGFFIVPQTMKQDQRDQFTKTFIDPITGNDASAHFGILEGGTDFKTLNIPPKDAEMLLSRRFSVEDIARFMGTPPVMIGHSAEGQTMWGTGVEATINMWLTLGLDAFWRSIEKSIAKRLLSAADRRRFYVEIDRKALLRADSKESAELYWKLVQVGALTPNQICDRENMPRFEGGDVRLVNTTLQPLSMAGQRTARVQPAPGEAIPED